MRVVMIDMTRHQPHHHHSPRLFYTHTAYGKRENVETTIHGRVIFDLLPYMFRNHKLSSYSLNSVSAEFLGQQKEVRCWAVDESMEPIEKTDCNRLNQTTPHHSTKTTPQDVHHSIISDLQNGTDEDRRRLAVYCIKDALLPMKLMEVRPSCASCMLCCPTH